jgi:phytoene/squalene synthetase
VLRISGYRDARLDAWSDAVCTALQLTNFWQDLEIDWRKGRLYVPEDLIHQHGANERDLDGRRVTPQWQAAVADAARRTRALFAAGRPIADAVGGRLRYELRATWLGGVRILQRLEAGGFDVYRHRPALGWRDAAPLGWQLITWRSSPPAR